MAGKNIPKKGHGLISPPEIKPCDQGLLTVGLIRAYLNPYFWGTSGGHGRTFMPFYQKTPTKRQTFYIFGRSRYT